MRVLVQIDLSRADLPLFEAYEQQVLTLLPKYGASVEARVRSIDGLEEVHLLHFPDAEALEAFRSDPARLAAQEIWTRCGASLRSKEVRHVR